MDYDAIYLFRSSSGKMIITSSGDGGVIGGKRNGARVRRAVEIKSLEDSRGARNDVICSRVPCHWRPALVIVVG